jgi:hypothetical protein
MLQDESSIKLILRDHCSALSYESQHQLLALSIRSRNLFPGAGILVLFG